VTYKKFTPLTGIVTINAQSWGGEWTGPLTAPWASSLVTVALAHSVPMTISAGQGASSTLTISAFDDRTISVKLLSGEFYMWNAAVTQKIRLNSPTLNTNIASAGSLAPTLDSWTVAERIGTDLTANNSAVISAAGGQFFAMARMVFIWQGQP
jgi:hypothetical protein